VLDLEFLVPDPGDFAPKAEAGVRLEVDVDPMSFL
jgi:hypothetical protein